MTSVIVQGYQELQAARVKLLAAMRPDGGLGKAVVYATAQEQRGVASRAHVDTGTYKSSIVPDVQGLMGRVYTESNRNPKSGARASVYGPIEEGRGGSHAAYGTTYRSDTSGIAADAIGIILTELP